MPSSATFPAWRATPSKTRAIPPTFGWRACGRTTTSRSREYAEPYPGRFITLAALPLWDPAEAVAEVERTAKRGIKGITFVFPHQFGYPHIVDPCWDPLWAAAQDAGLSINFHIGTGGSMGLDKSALWEGQSDMFRLAALSTWSISSNTQVMSILLFSGILERFPALRFVASESGLGWAPYLLEVADHQWERQNLSREGMPLKPSAYFRRQCYVNFWFEVFGAEGARRDRHRQHHVGVGLSPSHVHVAELALLHRARDGRLAGGGAPEGAR